MIDGWILGGLTLVVTTIIAIFIDRHAQMRRKIIADAWRKERSG